MEEKFGTGYARLALVFQIAIENECVIASASIIFVGDALDDARLSEVLD